MNNSINDSSSNTPGHWFLSRGSIVASVVLVTVGFLLATGHEAHLLGALPYLLFLACPLMHVFMHGGHHRKHEAQHKDQPEHGTSNPGDGEGREGR